MTDLHLLLACFDDDSLTQEQVPEAFQVEVAPHVQDDELSDLPTRRGRKCS